MKVITRSFCLEKNKFFKILLTNYLRRRLWLILIIVVFTFVLLFTPFFRDIFLFSIIYAFVVLLLIVWIPSYFYYHAHSKKNRNFYKNRIVELEDDFLKVTIEDGSFDMLKLENIINVVKRKDAFFLYVSRIQFIYIPFDAFSSSEDLKTFETILKAKSIEFKK